MRTKTLALPGVNVGRNRYVVSVRISLPTTPKELVQWTTAGCYSVALVSLTVVAFVCLGYFAWWVVS